MSSFQSISPNKYTKLTDGFLKGKLAFILVILSIHLSMTCYYFLADQDQWVHDKAILMKWDSRYNSRGRMGTSDEVPKSNFAGGDTGIQMHMTNNMLWGVADCTYGSIAQIQLSICGVLLTRV